LNLTTSLASFKFKMSTQNPSYGTKVTDPNAPAKEEFAGAVASDSLAADSTRSGGVFSENRGAAPQSVSGNSSTFANTNTSGATKLDPAPDAESRLAQDSWKEEKGVYPDAVGDQSKSTAVEDTTGSNQTGGNTGSADAAPTYVNNQYIRDPSGPKGANLTEGGFDSDDKNNASFNNEIGTENDPGRLAEGKFQRENAESGPDAGYPRQKGVTGEGSFDALGGETSA